MSRCPHQEVSTEWPVVFPVDRDGLTLPRHRAPGRLRAGGAPVNSHSSQGAGGMLNPVSQPNSPWNTELCVFKLF